MVLFNKFVKSKRLWEALLPHVVIIIVFSLVYSMMINENPENFNYDKNVHSIEGGAYIAVVTQTTLGYGTVFPKSRKARYVCMLQSLISFVVILGTIEFNLEFLK
jgi:hypothetical protein